MPRKKKLKRFRAVTAAKELATCRQGELCLTGKRIKRSSTKKPWGRCCRRNERPLPDGSSVERGPDRGVVVQCQRALISRRCAARAPTEERRSRSGRGRENDGAPGGEG